MKGEKWKTWDKTPKYGDVFYDRATGKMPEMESSKAVASRISRLASAGDSILDVGCGGGHYLVSLDKTMVKPFSYTGVDATEYYIEKAKEAFSGKSAATGLRCEPVFDTGDIFNLQHDDNSFDIVFCSNVLLHLPSVTRPLSELVRVSRRYVLIRTLVGNEPFRIMHVISPEEYNEDGDPEKFNYFNIYSESFMRSFISVLPGVKNVSFEPDNDFNPDNIGSTEYVRGGKEVPVNLTRIINGMQVNNYIIEPWCFVLIEKK